MRNIAIGLVYVVLASCSATENHAADFGPPGSDLHVESTPVDAPWAAAIEADARSGRDTIDAFFGAPFRSSLTIRVMPSRAAFDAYAGANWGFPSTQCWMVGAAETDGLLLLSPRVWTTEACEHDPTDAAHVRGIIVHELVHTYHMQVNPSDEFEGATDIDWFVEGLAVYASGQFDDERRDAAARIVATGDAPDALSQGWTGDARYAVAGSMVAFIDERWGRDTLRDSLSATSQAEILAALGVSEAEFMTGWRRWAGALATAR